MHFVIHSTYIKFKAKNDLNEVKKLQTFFNKFEGEKLNLSGIYNKKSFEAVKRFQKKYQLKPTGYVYKATLKKINEIYCQGKKQ